MLSILLFTCLWNSGCQPKPVNTPTPAPTAASTEDILSTSLEKVLDLETQKDYEGALAILSNLRSENPTYASEHAVELNDRAAQLYIGWGNNLRESAHYLTALEKYALAQAATTTTALRTQIEQEIQKTNDFLANDSGGDGQALLDAAMAEACYQEVVPSNPLIGSTIPEGEPGRILVCDYSEAYQNVAVAPGLDAQLVQAMLAAQAGMHWLPDDLAATTPGGVRFSISRLDSYTESRTCEYANNQGLTDAIGVMRQESIVMLRDMFSGESLGQKTFNGANPAYTCPQTKQYGVDNFGFGEMVDNQKIIAWVRQLLEEYKK